MSNLQLELKNMIIETLDLEDIDPEDIVDSEPLFIEGLGLDSIDALELGLALQKVYGINLDSDSEESRKHFSSIDALAALVASRRTK